MIFDFKKNKIRTILLFLLFFMLYMASFFIFYKKYTWTELSTNVIFLSNILFAIIYMLNLLLISIVAVEKIIRKISKEIVNSISDNSSDKNLSKYHFLNSYAISQLKINSLVVLSNLIFLTFSFQISGNMKIYIPLLIQSIIFLLRIFMFGVSTFLVFKLYHYTSRP